MRIRPHFLLLIAFSFCAFHSLANLNERQYAFRSLDINNGLSQNSVNAILQDRQGFMWFGTKDGLDRYDGISFQTYMKESGNLGNSYINALYEDGQGQIWIGTDIGLYVYSPLREATERFNLKSNLNTTIDNTVNSIVGDKKGGIWITVQDQGIFYYHSSSNQLINRQADQAGKVKFRGLERICFDAENICWIDVHDDNLYYSKDLLTTVTPFFSKDKKESLGGDYVCKMVAGPYNCLYLGTVSGLKEVNLTNKTVRTLLSKDELGDHIYVREISFYSDDELWIGTESGVFIYNLRTNKVVHLRSMNGDSYSISDRNLHHLQG